MSGDCLLGGQKRPFVHSPPLILVGTLAGHCLLVDSGPH